MGRNSHGRIDGGPLTGEERLDFKEMRQEMRDGFRDVTAAVTLVGNRVSALEMYRAHEEGALSARAEERTAAEKSLERGRQMFMWRVGLLVTAIFFAVSVTFKLLGWY
jgi:hypothetical protein